MFYKTTAELEKYVKDIYQRLQPMAEKDGIFLPISCYFAESTPLNQPGDYCFSGERGYHYCGIGDRGERFLNNVTSSIFEVSYWVIKFQVFLMASNYEHTHHICGRDFRRVMFAKALELFDALGGNYRKRAEIDIDEILKESPYDDVICG